MRSDQVGNQVGRVGRPQASNRIPACRGRIAGDGGGSLVTANGDIEEIVSVGRGIGRDFVECRIDVAQIMSGHLIGNRGQPGPLG